MQIESLEMLRMSQKFLNFNQLPGIAHAETERESAISRRENVNQVNHWEINLIVKISKSFNCHIYLYPNGFMDYLYFYINIHIGNQKF